MAKLRADRSAANGYTPPAMGKSDMVSLRRRALAWYTPYGLYGVLRRALRGCDTVLDLGCGTESILHLFTGRSRLVGVDRYRPSLERNRSHGTYFGHVNADILELPVAPKSVDACVALDVIEHFERSAGEAMMEAMERVARRRVIVFTPNGFLPQAATDNPWQLHRSGWTVADFRERGFRVYGIYGMKALRGELSRLRFGPRLVWEPVSWASQAVARLRPEAAFALCAVKTVDRALA